MKVFTLKISWKEEFHHPSFWLHPLNQCHCRYSLYVGSTRTLSWDPLISTLVGSLFMEWDIHYDMGLQGQLLMEMFIQNNPRSELTWTFAYLIVYLQKRIFESMQNYGRQESEKFQMQTLIHPSCTTCNKGHQNRNCWQDV